MSEDVFSRLFKDSTVGLRARSSLRSSQQKRNDSSQWDLKLAAECRLVDNQPVFQHANKPIQLNSLTTQSLNKRSRKKSKTAPTTPRLNQSQLRPISYVLSQDGSVERTEWYYITDSVEPPPYKGPKPKKAQLISTHQGISQTYGNKLKSQNDRPLGVSDYELDYIRKELRKIQRKKVIWAHTNSTACDHRMPQTENEKPSNEEPEIDMVDLVTPLDIAKKPKAMKVVSYACRSWEHSGYPTSLSFLLEK